MQRASDEESREESEKSEEDLLSKESGDEFEKSEEDLPTKCELALWSAGMFGQQFTLNGTSIMFLAYEMNRLYPQQASLMTGLVSFASAIFSVSAPIMGMFVDRNRSSWGKRRPVIALGAGIGALSYVFAGLCSGTVPFEVQKPIALACFVLTFAGLSAIMVGQNALVYEIVPKECRGQASGIVGTMKTIGTIVAVVCIVIFVNVPMEQWMYYGCALALVASASITCMSVSEPSTDFEPQPNPLAMRDFVEAYSVDVHSSFWLVTVSRGFYYAAIAVQGVMFFYFRDVFHFNDAAQKMAVIGAVLIGQISTAIVSPIAGKISDSIGRKALLYFAAGNLAVVYAFFWIAPATLSTQTQENLHGFSPALLAVYGDCLLFGIGNGAWRAGDYALAMDCLPDGHKSAQDLAIWNLGTFFGLGAGQLLTGLLLNTCVERYDEHGAAMYSLGGYGLAMSVGILASIITGIVIKFI